MTELPPNTTMIGIKTNQARRPPANSIDEIFNYELEDSRNPESGENSMHNYLQVKELTKMVGGGIISI